MIHLVRVFGAAASGLLAAVFLSVSIASADPGSAGGNTSTEIAPGQDSTAKSPQGSAATKKSQPEVKRPQPILNYPIPIESLW